MKITIDKERGCWVKREECKQGTSPPISDREVEILNDFFGISVSKKCWTVVSFETVPKKPEKSYSKLGNVVFITDCDSRCYSISLKKMTLWEKIRFIWWKDWKELVLKMFAS